MQPVKQRAASSAGAVGRSVYLASNPTRYVVAYRTADGQRSTTSAGLKVPTHDSHGKPLTGPAYAAELQRVHKLALDKAAALGCGSSDASSVNWPSRGSSTDSLSSADGQAALLDGGSSNSPTVTFVHSDDE